MLPLGLVMSWLQWRVSLCGVQPHALPVPSQHGYSPGPEPAGSMVTRTELSRGTGPPSTRHTYSPESIGDTWYSRSREPWVWQREGGIREEFSQDPNTTPTICKLHPPVSPWAHHQLWVNPVLC